MRRNGQWASSAAYGTRTLAAAAVLALAPVAPPAAAQVQLELVRSIPTTADASSPAFHRITDIGIRGEHVYVLDHLETTVRVFDGDGALVREFGGRGGAPAEFRLPFGLELAGDTVIITDRGGRLVQYSAAGEFIGEVSRLAGSLEDGRSEFRMLPFRSGAALVETRSSVGRDGEELADVRMGEILFIPPRARRARVIGRGIAGTVLMSVDGRLHPAPSDDLGPELVWAGRTDGRFAVIDTYDGTVSYWRAAGTRATRTHVRDLGWTPEPVPADRCDDERRRNYAATIVGAQRARRATFHCPAFFGRVNFGLMDDDGTIWLQRTPTWSSRERPAGHRDSWIVVPADGSDPVREVVLPERSRLVSVVGGLLGVVHADELGVQRVRIYRQVRRAP